jgi:hypothetical protein
MFVSHFVVLSKSLYALNIVAPADIARAKRKVFYLCLKTSGLRSPIKAFPISIDHLFGAIECIVGCAP